MSTSSFIETFRKVRFETESITEPLLPEDTVMQPYAHVSPPKWHLAHTTWFFENFILKEFEKDFQPFNPNYNFLFNSYYQACGERLPRNKRGCLNRPLFQDVLSYRRVVTEKILCLIQNSSLPKNISNLIELGIHHEQQHQELLYMDILNIFFTNPLKPSYNENSNLTSKEISQNSWIDFFGGESQIGYEGNGFCFDNELGIHNVLLQPFQLQKNLVTNREYLAFIESGGYDNFDLWHDEGWTWLKTHNISKPAYWVKKEDVWHEFTLQGLQALNLNQPVSHLSFYEAFAFAESQNARLPTEFEWEHAADQISWGDLWEWTSSSYTPYPGFQKNPGAVGEYNGKFMVNQKVLRGSCFATPINHSRKTYRNFYYPNQRWMFSGLRLARSL